MKFFIFVYIFFCLFLKCLKSIYYKGVLWRLIRGDDFVFSGSSSAVRGTTRLVSTIFQQLSERSGVKLFPHKLCHTYATQCLAAGIDIHVLQRQLGHEDIKMTIRYVHIADSIRFASKRFKNLFIIVSASRIFSENLWKYQKWFEHSTRWILILRHA